MASGDYSEFDDAGNFGVKPRKGVNPWDDQYSFYDGSTDAPYIRRAPSNGGLPATFDPNFNYAQAYSQDAADNLQINAENPGGVQSLRDASTGTAASGAPSFQPDYGSAALTGWDAGKWADPTHQSLKYQAGRFMAGQGGKPTAAGLSNLADYLKSLGYNAQYGGGDGITVDGTYIDMATNYNKDTGTGDAWGWMPGTTGKWADGTNYGNEGSQLNLTPGGPNGYGGDSSIYDSIMKLLKRGESPVDPNDPAIQGQFAPIDAQLQRGAQRSRDTAAERLAFEGLNNGGKGGALDAAVTGINEDLGQQEASAMGGLLGSELSARRQDVVNALTFAQGEEKLALEKQLAEIDAQLRSQSISNQNQQFYDNMGYNMGHDQAMFDYLYNSLAAGG